MSAIIQASNVSHRYGRYSSVTDLSLTLEYGEVMALLGTNGAGKTTTLRLLTGDLAPDSGNISINNIDISRHPLKAKQKLGYLPDHAPIYGDLTVDEYLTFCAYIHGLSKKHVQKRLKTVKQFCELQSVGRRLIKKLSKGYQQRVGIAQAIIHEPKAIILDEPTNGLDPTQIQEMRELVLYLRDHAAVLLSTHQLNEVEQVCDRVLMLKNGHTVLCEKINQLQQTNRIRIRFLSTIPYDELSSHQYVKTVNPVNDTIVEILTDENLDTVKSALLMQACTNGWGIMEIHDVQQTLEDIFVSEVLRDTR